MKGPKNIRGITHIRESFKTRQTRYGGYAALITIAVIAGLILVNLIVGQLSPQLDLTQSKLYSLSEQTQQVLGQINTPVKIYGMWKPGEESQDIMTVVNLYLAKNKNLSLQVIDPDKNPGFVTKYDKEKKGISRGSLIVEGDKGFKVIGPYDMYDFTQNQQGGGSSVTGVAVERRMTSALLFVGTGITPIVYELTGHGEIALSALNFQDTVERENFSLKSLNLLLTAIPDDASVIIINGPRRDIGDAEAQKLLDYLGKGGRLLVLADYNIGTLTNLNNVLASYGVAFQYGVTVETNSNYMINLPFSEIPDMVDHDITKPLADKSKTPVLLQGAMAITPLDTKRRTVDIKPLMTTSSGAYLRTDLTNNAAGKIPSDVSGPLVLGMAIMDPSYIQGTEPQARIVLIGCSNLLPIAAQVGVDSNRDMFMNSLTWLGDRPESISVRSKSLYLLPMRLNLVQIVIFGGLFILIIPIAFFITGFVTWLKRRHL